jgi:LPS sulfotransferase NodH
VSVPRSSLPSIIAVGPQRTATTWLHRLLQGHAGVPRTKELDFFNANYERGLEWYAQFFSDCPPGLPKIEICPNYFATPIAIERIAADLPDCRIVCTLRDPLERAWSHYRLLRGRGFTHADFEQLATTPGSVIHESGRYAFFIAKWFECFGRDNVLVLLYEDLIADPPAFIGALCSFMGIPPIPIAQHASELKRVNVATHDAKRPRMAHAGMVAMKWLEAHHAWRLKKIAAKLKIWRMCFASGDEFAPLSQEVASRMRAFYEPEILATEKLLGRNLDIWRRADAAHESRSSDFRRAASDS